MNSKIKELLSSVGQSPSYITQAPPKYRQQIAYDSYSWSTSANDPYYDAWVSVVMPRLIPVLMALFDIVAVTYVASTRMPILQSWLLTVICLVVTQKKPPKEGGSHKNSIRCQNTARITPFSVNNCQKFCKADLTAKRPEIRATQRFPAWSAPTTTGDIITTTPHASVALLEHAGF